MGLLSIVFIIFLILLISGGIITSNEKNKIHELGESQKHNFVEEEKLFQQYLKKEQVFQTVYATSPKLIFATKHSLHTFDNTVKSDGMCFLTDDALCFFKNEDRVYEKSPCEFKNVIFWRTEYKTTTYETKDKSVVGRAVVGGVLAGPVGAIVGAASGLSNDGTKSVGKRVGAGVYKLHIMPKGASSQEIKPTLMLVRNDVIEKNGTPPNCKRSISNDNYDTLLVPDYYTYKVDVITEEDFKYILELIKD